MAVSDLTSHGNRPAKSETDAGGKIEKGHPGDAGRVPAWAGKAPDTDRPGRQQNAIGRRPLRAKKPQHHDRWGVYQGMQWTWEAAKSDEKYRVFTIFIQMAPFCVDGMTVYVIRATTSD